MHDVSRIIWLYTVPLLHKMGQSFVFTLQKPIPLVQKKKTWCKVKGQGHNAWFDLDLEAFSIRCPRSKHYIPRWLILGKVI